MNWKWKEEKELVEDKELEQIILSCVEDVGKDFSKETTAEQVAELLVEVGKRSDSIEMEFKKELGWKYYYICAWGPVVLIMRRWLSAKIGFKIEEKFLFYETPYLQLCMGQIVSVSEFEEAYGIGKLQWEFAKELMEVTRKFSSPELDISDRVRQAVYGALIL